MSVIRDLKLESLLVGLHSRSDAQVAAMRSFFDPSRTNQAQPPAAKEARAFLSDKLVALDSDKAEFCYQLCRANNARRIVEIGTSYGVSTLYLAAAVRDNVHAAGGNGVVIGTEYEANKASAARAHFEQAGLSRYIDLRVRRPAPDAQADRRASGFHAGGYLGRDGAAGAGVGYAAFKVGSHRDQRQYGTTSRRICGLFRISRRKRLPDHDAAIRRWPGIVGALLALRG